MAKVRGETIYVEVWESADWHKVGGQKDASMSFSQDARDVTDKDSAGWKQNELGNRSVEVSFDSFLIEDNTYWLELKKGLINLAAAHQKCTCRVTTPAYTYTGDWVMTGLSISGPTEDMATVSFSLTSDGQITEATV